MLSKKSFEINSGTKKLNRKLQSTRKGTSPDQTVQGILNCPWVSPQMGSLASQPLAPSHFSDLRPMLGLAPLQPAPQSKGNESPLSGLLLTTRTSWLGRKPLGQPVFALSQSVQVGFLPAGVFFLCQLETTEHPGFGPGLWSCAQSLAHRLAHCLGIVKCLDRVSVPSAY